MSVQRRGKEQGDLAYWEMGGVEGSGWSQF